jgi:Rrf2 family protein
MKISTRARYGTRLMLALGVNYGQRPVFLKEIAKAEEISEKYLSQIIMPLKAAGLVNSFRGAHGGYVLSRAPAQISLKDIVGVLEGDFNLVGCVGNPSECSRVSICVTRDLWSKLGRQISEMLKTVTLEDLVKRFKEKRQTSLMYAI